MNIILNTDSYKHSHFNQYPKGTDVVYSYIESRGIEKNFLPEGEDEIVFFGLRPFMQDVLEKRITAEDIEEAEMVLKPHGLPFYREGWKYILENKYGYLPLDLMCLPDGSITKPNEVMISIWNTDPKCFWLTSFIETALLRAIWYPSTVATLSRAIKKIILKALVKSSGYDPKDTIRYKLHDFGARGVSSYESACIGGLAHLINFSGTDTLSALAYGRKYYTDMDCAGHSIPAMEHSTVTSWGRDSELRSYANMINRNCKEGGIVALVCDSYDIYKACDMIGDLLKDMIEEKKGTVVIRPDSGEPVEVLTKCLCILDAKFGSKTNSKGYKELNTVKLLWGDGIDINTIQTIIDAVHRLGYSIDNIAFGMGGGLLQKVNRDSLKFAMKCSAIRVDGETRDVYKDPITDTGKRSKRGVVMPKNDIEEGVLDYRTDSFKLVRKRAEVSYEQKV